MANTWNSKAAPNRQDKMFPRILPPYTYDADGNPGEWQTASDVSLSAADADPTTEPFCAKIACDAVPAETDMYMSIYARYSTQTTTTEFFVTPCFYNRYTSRWYKGAKVKIVHTPTEDYGQIANIEVPAGSSWLKIEVSGLGASDVAGLCAVPRNGFKRA